MPTIRYEFQATGQADVIKAIRSVGRARRKHLGAPYPPVQTSALVAAMAGVGPSYEWAWFDYLSPGDALRVARLRDITLAKMTPDDVHEAAMLAIEEIRRVAEERMRAANPASDA
jgi:hypothetical protein